MTPAESAPLRALVEQWRDEANALERNLVFNIYHGNTSEDDPIEALRSCADALEAALRLQGDAAKLAPEHRCGVRGFADSGDTCPGCAAPPARVKDASWRQHVGKDPSPHAKRLITKE